jgi:cephalosporin hydroxylase
MKNFETTAKSQLILSNGGTNISVDLYSEEGVDLVNALYLKLGAQFQWMYQPTWLGRPIIQFPHDVVAVQELIWKLKPDLIIECGVAHGGSLVLSASICELLGKGKVIGVDIEIRPHNRQAIEAHPLAHRIELVESSSIDEAAVEALRKTAIGAETVLVILDSNHTHDHVRRELEAYCQIVTPGSYLVAMDGAQAYVGDIPRAKAGWKSDHPLTAIHEFLKAHPEYEIDPHYTRFGVTSNPDGFLKRKA